LGEQERRSFRCQNKVMCGGQEMWSKAEYNKMIWNRDEYIWKIKDVVECRSRGSRDQSHVIRVMEFESVVR
jgi:hypothetical protein